LDDDVAEYTYRMSLAGVYLTFKSLADRMVFLLGITLNFSAGNMQNKFYGHFFLGYEEYYLL
jgi:hypothetical protein